MLLKKCYQQWVGNIWRSMERQQVRKSILSNLAEHSFLRPIFPPRIKKNINALLSITIRQRQRQLQLVVFIDDCSPIHCCYQKSFCWHSVSKSHWWTPSSPFITKPPGRVLLKFIQFHRVTTDLKLNRRKSLFVNIPLNLKNRLFSRSGLFFVFFFSGLSFSCNHGKAR